jgi:flagellar biosynthesis chaperone FliJ
MIKLAQEDLEKLVIFMRECGDKLGKATTDLDLLESKTKELESQAFLSADGTIKDKEHKARTCKLVVENNGKIATLRGLVQQLRWSLKVSEIECDLFRSVNSNKRLERKLYEHLG